MKNDFLTSQQVAAEAAARHLAACGITRFAIAFHQSGLGDQLLTATVVSKISAMVGLKLLGVVAESVADRNRIDDLFDHQSEGGWFKETFGDRFPLVPVDQCERHFISGQTPEDLIRTLLAFSPKKSSCDILALYVTAVDAAAVNGNLRDQRGNSLVNPFHDLCQEFDRSNLPYCGKRLFLSHLRIGDMIPLSGLREGHVTLPLQNAHGNLHLLHIETSKYPQHSRNPGFEYFTKIALTLRDRFQDLIDFCVITDGIDRPLNNLKLDYVTKQIAEECKIQNLEKILERASLEYQEKFTFLKTLGVTIIGEGRKQFRDSIEILKRADITLTTSGHFATSVQCCLSPLTKRQSIFQSKRTIEWPERENIDINLLTGDLERDLVSLTDRIATLS